MQIEWGPGRSGRSSSLELVAAAVLVVGVNYALEPSPSD